MEGILRFKMDWAVTIKQLALTVHGLIFGRAYYRKDFCVGDLGGLFSGGLLFFVGGGGAYYRNFTVSSSETQGQLVGAEWSKSGKHCIGGATKLIKSVAPPIFFPIYFVRRPD